MYAPSFSCFNYRMIELKAQSKHDLVITHGNMVYMHEKARKGRAQVGTTVTEFGSTNAAAL